MFVDAPVHCCPSDEMRFSRNELAPQLNMTGKEPPSCLDAYK